MTTQTAIEFDNSQSGNEGWGIFDCEGSENSPFQLQREDEAELFEDDESAWSHVVAKAAEGSEYHLAALRFLKANNPAELDAIAEWVAIPSRLNLIFSA